MMNIFTMRKSKKEPEATVYDAAGWEALLNGDPKES